MAFCNDLGSKWPACDPAFSDTALHFWPPSAPHPACPIPVPEPCRPHAPTRLAPADTLPLRHHRARLGGAMIGNQLPVVTKPWLHRRKVGGGRGARGVDSPGAGPYTERPPARGPSVDAGRRDFFVSYTRADQAWAARDRSRGIGEAPRRTGQPARRVRIYTEPSAPKWGSGPSGVPAG